MIGLAGGFVALALAVRTILLSFLDEVTACLGSALAEVKHQKDPHLLSGR
jgi:hypothetical protein